MTPISRLLKRGQGSKTGAAALGYEHLLVTVVAVLIAATALWYGGNPPEITAGISMVTWWAVAIGVSFGLIPASRLTKSAIVPLALLATLTILTGLSFFWTNNEGQAFNSLVQMSGVLGLFLLAIFCSRPGSALAWLKGMALGLGFLVILAALSRLIPGIGDDAEIAKTLYGASGRLSWPLGYWNALAAVTAMAALLAVWFGSILEDRRWRWASVAVLPTYLLVLYLTSSRASLLALLVGAGLLFVMEPRRKGLLIAWTVGILGGAILVVSVAQMSDLVHAAGNSNADKEGFALLAITLAVTAAVVLYMRQFEDRLRARPVPRPSLAVWIGIGVVVLVGIVLINPVKQVDSFVAIPDVKSKIEDNDNQTTYHLLSAGGSGRWQYWSAAFEAFGEKPFFGIGAGGYQDFYTSNRDTLVFGRHPHSLPLKFLSELGLIGFLLAAGFFGWIIWVGWRRWRIGSGSQAALNSETDQNPFLSDTIPPFAALIAAGMVSMSLDWTSEFPVIAAPILISMAALVGQATRRPRSGEPAKQPALDAKPGKKGFLGNFPPEFVSVLAILFAGAGILFSTWGFGISHNVEQSKQDLRDGDVQGAIDQAQDAVDLAPWSAGAMIQLLNAQEADGEYGKALISADRAIPLAKLNSAGWLAKYRIATYLGDEGAAKEAKEEARKIDPHSPLFELNPKILGNTVPVPPVSQ